MGAVPGDTGTAVRGRHECGQSQVHEESPGLSSSMDRDQPVYPTTHLLGTRGKRMHSGQLHFRLLHAQTWGRAVREATRRGRKDGGRMRPKAPWGRPLLSYPLVVFVLKKSSGESHPAERQDGTQPRNHHSIWVHCAHLQLLRGLVCRPASARLEGRSLRVEGLPHGIKGASLLTSSRAPQRARAAGAE